MATKYQMQAKSSADGALYSWLSVLLDWVAAGYAGPGSPLDVAFTGGGLDNSAALNPFQVTAGGVAVTAGGAEVDATTLTNLVTASGVQVTAGGINVAA